jgi:hypothetical protein
MEVFKTIKAQEEMAPLVNSPKVTFNNNNKRKNRGGFFLTIFYGSSNNKEALTTS